MSLKMISGGIISIGLAFEIFFIVFTFNFYLFLNNWGNAVVGLGPLRLLFLVKEVLRRFL